MYWIAIVVGFLALLILPTAAYEFWMRSDYRAFLRHQRAQEAWRRLTRS